MLPSAFVTTAASAIGGPATGSTHGARKAFWLLVMFVLARDVQRSLCRILSLHLGVQHLRCQQRQHGQKQSATSTTHHGGPSQTDTNPIGRDTARPPLRIVEKPLTLKLWRDGDRAYRDLASHGDLKNPSLA